MNDFRNRSFQPQTDREYRARSAANKHSPASHRFSLLKMGVSGFPRLTGAGLDERPEGETAKSVPGGLTTAVKPVHWSMSVPGVSPRIAAIMLVLSRKKDEAIVINDDITIVVVEIRGDKVRLGVEAPKEVPVHRREVFDAIRFDSVRVDPDRQDAAAIDGDPAIGERQLFEESRTPGDAVAGPAATAAGEPLQAGEEPPVA
jgi:carbon storage regulator